MLQMQSGVTVKAKNPNGNEISCYYARANYSRDVYVNYLDAFGFYGMNNPIATSYTLNRVVLGDGSDEPKIDDYKLSGNIITGISSTVSRNVSTDGDDAIISSVFTVTNNNSNDITISEVAYCGNVCGISTGGAAGLFERTVLESPITIPAGGVGQVTYTIRIKHPTV